MIIKEYKTIFECKSEAGALFDARNGAPPEHENVIVLRIMQAIIDRTYTNFRLWCIHDEGGPRLAAAMTPPHNIALSQGDPAAITPFIDYIQAESIDFPGINGPAALTRAFTSIWNDHNPKKLTPAIQLPLYIIKETLPPRLSAGSSRLATLADLDLLTGWYVDFGVEAGMLPHECKPNPEKVTRKIKSDSLFIWQNTHGTPVSFAGYAQASPNGMTVGPVYTPPEHRGHGYASNMVANLSEQILRQGKWCGLFADAKNPISNKIYQQIGYKQVFEYQEYRF